MVVLWQGVIYVILDKISVFYYTYMTKFFLAKNNIFSNITYIFTFDPSFGIIEKIKIVLKTLKSSIMIL